MNRRQAKKAYKKKYGHNPPKKGVRFQRKLVIKAMEELTGVMKSVFETMKKMCEAAVQAVNETTTMMATITLLEELDRYRAIGTAEECREAVEKQIKLKEWIDAYNQPEFKNITWNTEEVIGLLKEFVVD